MICMTEDHDAGLVEKVARAMSQCRAEDDQTARSAIMAVLGLKGWSNPEAWKAADDYWRLLVVSAASVAIAAVREHDAHRGEGR